jgi:DNA-binding transcriptional MerR regulator
MLKIGDFSRLGRVTVKALRYYDEIGLLKPVSIDPITGYRYYSSDQLPRLNRILALKDLDLSLEQIGRMLDEDLSPDKIREILRIKRAELQAQMRDVKMRLERVEARLKQIEGEGKTPDQRSKSFDRLITASHKANHLLLQEDEMSSLQVISADSFGDFREKLRIGQTDYLTMILGTVKESLEQTEWAETFDDQYFWLIDNLEEGYCLYTLRKAEKALWISLILPSDWEQRFTILEASLPNLIDWFKKNDACQYLYGKMEGNNYPPTLIDSFLPFFLKNGFKTEHRMAMKRDGRLPIPDALPLSKGFTKDGYSEENLDEIATLASEVYTKDGVDYNFNDAKAYVLGCVEDELFHKSAMFLRGGTGKLIGAIWCGIDDNPYLGELVVLQDYQGKGLGRYLFNGSLTLFGKSG